MAVGNDLGPVGHADALPGLVLGQDHQLVDAQVDAPRDVPLARIAGRAEGAVVLLRAADVEDRHLAEARRELVDVDVAHAAPDQLELRGDRGPREQTLEPGVSARGQVDAEHGPARAAPTGRRRCRRRDRSRPAARRAAARGRSARRAGRRSSRRRAASSKRKTASRAAPAPRRRREATAAPEKRSSRYSMITADSGSTKPSSRIGTLPRGVQLVDPVGPVAEVDLDPLELDRPSRRGRSATRAQ